MIDVQPADVAVAGPAEVISLDVMIGDRADGRRTRNETILIVVPTGVVEVREEAQLPCITFPN